MQGPAAVLATVLLLAGACSGAAEVPAGPPVDTVAVGLTDFAIAASADRLAAGPVTLEVTNAGATAHDLRVAAADLDVATAALPPGASTSLQIDVAGDEALTLWCTLPSHRDRGMQTTLVVDAVESGQSP